MLARYQIVRGRRRDALPSGVRQDTRKHTRHILRPDAEAVVRYLADPSETGWARFRATYVAAVEGRFEEDRAAFDALAELARAEDVYLGCSCPTRKNPDVRHCHTVLALELMQRHYPDLDVVFPSGEAGDAGS